MHQSGSLGSLRQNRLVSASARLNLDKPYANSTTQDSTKKVSTQENSSAQTKGACSRSQVKAATMIEVDLNSKLMKSRYQPQSLDETSQSRFKKH